MRERISRSRGVSESIGACDVEACTTRAAMAALVGGLREDRAGEGMAEAVRQIGLVLAEHFPRSADDVNELPDRVIEL